MEKDIINWLKSNKEFRKEQFGDKFKLPEESLIKILDFLISNKIIFEPAEGLYHTMEIFDIFPAKIEIEIAPKIKELTKSLENIQGTEVFALNDWGDLKEIDRFVIFDGSERIYDIELKGKKIRLEGKEIMDYNIFILRFFEEFGRMLPKYKGIGNDWAMLVSYWYRKYGEISKDKIEIISDIQEAKEVIIDYINNCTVSDTHLVREGIVCIKEDSIYVSTKIIKKLLKRNNLKVSLRKLAYVFNEYLLSGSIPYKVENKSERFWKFKKDMFEIDMDVTLNIKVDEDA